jgi:hypothetical protein
MQEISGYRWLELEGVTLNARTTKGHGKPLFDGWILIGKALIVGRTQCMAKAGVNSP